MPYPGRSTGAVRWLVPPDGSGRLTDPVVLELAMHEAAAHLAGGPGGAGPAGPAGATGGGGGPVAGERRGPRRTP
ncbi:hypothetical protein AA958_26190 [Streptomyces sp. CNQ-509]|nr:hypothetical protein AA958_26190 [Streptomyces sp. CNQ-509]